MRYLIDTVDGLGFGKSDPFTAWTRRGANRIADKLGDRSRIRRARSGVVVRDPTPYSHQIMPDADPYYEPWPCELYPDEYECDGGMHSCM